MCQSEIANPNVHGPESLAYGDFSQGSPYWNATNGFTISGGKAVYSPNTSALGLLTQAINYMAVAGVTNRWYKFEYKSTIPSGDITENSYTLTVVDPFDFQENDPICVKGAGTGGGDLITTIDTISGNSFTLTDLAETTVSNAEVQHATTGDISASSKYLSIADAIDFVNGMWICVKGAGESGADLITTIASGGGTTTLTLADAASITKNDTEVTHYSLEYSASIPTFSPVLVGLTCRNGTRAVYFKSTAAPENFSIWAKPVSGSFKLDDVSLKEFQGGDVIAHGLLTGGGTAGIKVLSNGAVGIGQTSPASGLHIGINAGGSYKGYLTLEDLTTHEPDAPGSGKAIIYFRNGNLRAKIGAYETEYMFTLTT
jgi:hypothetical protein